MDASEYLLAFALKYANDWNRMYSAIKNREALTEADEASVNSFSGNYITILDSEYPDRLKQRYKPPFVLYYDGDLSLLSRVDDNGCKNDLVFLHGPNTLRIPSAKLCTLTADNKVDICGGLLVWFNKTSTNVDRYGLAAALCHNIVGTKIYPVNSHSWFVRVTIPNALAMGDEVYMVASAEPSLNNRLIKDGCNLIDCYEDILSHSPSNNMSY